MNTKYVDLPASLRKVLRLSVRMPVLVAVCTLALTSVVAQTAPRHSTPSLSKNKKTRRTAKPESPAPAPELPAAEPHPAPPLTPEEMPPKVPEVYWDGKQLTITSDNSTLADILAAIRTLTGAELDIPPTASRERVAARLGPGPAREILSTLLSGSDFDYVIQASDTNLEGVRSVLLTPRGKSDVTVAKGGPGAVAESPARAAYRSNYARPNPSPSAEEVLDTASNQSESPAELTPPSSQSGGATAQPATAAVQPAPIEAPAVAVNAQPAQTDLASPAAIADSSANQAPVSAAEQRIQQMQTLFQQRKQMMEDAHKQAPAN